MGGTLIRSLVRRPRLMPYLELFLASGDSQELQASVGHCASDDGLALDSNWKYRAFCELE